MQIKALLNACHRFKGFVYRAVGFERIRNENSIVDEVRPRSNSKPVCSGCGKKSSG